MTDPNQYNPQVPQPTPQYNQPNYGQQAPQYGTPDYSQAPSPQYGDPTYGQQQYGQAQYGQPQYGQGPSANYGQPAPAPQAGDSFFALTAPLDMPAYGCNMGEAVVRFFKKYAVFKGRASRGEFWWWILANYIIVFALGCLFGLLGTITDSDAISTIDDLVGTLWGLGTLVPTLALGVRRLHDVNLRGTTLAIIYGVQVVAMIILIIGLVFIGGGAISALNGSSGNLAAIGIVMSIVGVLAMLGSIITYIYLMAKRTNPEGARFDDPNTGTLPYPNGMAPTNDPYAAPQQYAAQYNTAPQYNAAQQYDAAPQNDAYQQYAAPAAPTTPVAQQPAMPPMPTAPAADPYAAQAAQYNPAPQQYAAPAVPTAPVAQQPTMPPMPAVPTVPTVPPMPAMPQAPAQFQEPYGAAPTESNTPVEPSVPTEQSAPTNPTNPDAPADDNDQQR